MGRGWSLQNSTAGCNCLAWCWHASPMLPPVLAGWACYAAAPQDCWSRSEAESSKGGKIMQNHPDWIYGMGQTLRPRTLQFLFHFFLLEPNGTSNVWNTPNFDPQPCRANRTFAGIFWRGSCDECHGRGPGLATRVQGTGKMCHVPCIISSDDLRFSPMISDEIPIKYALNPIKIIKSMPFRWNPVVCFPSGELRGAGGGSLRDDKLSSG